MNKKGLTPVIATALLISLVVILSSIVFLWARGFVSEQIQKFNQPIDFLCERVEWTVNIAESGTNFIVQANNRGNVPIYGFSAKKISGGTEESKQYKLTLSEGQANEIIVDLRLDNGERPDEIVFSPSLLGNVIGKEDSKKAYVCLTSAKRYFPQKL